MCGVSLEKPMYAFTHFQGHCRILPLFPYADGSFPNAEELFPNAEASFPSVERHFPNAEERLPYAEAPFPLRKCSFPYAEDTIFVPSGYRDLILNCNSEHLNPQRIY